jgi:signal transduction histidine kinase
MPYPDDRLRAPDLTPADAEAGTSGTSGAASAEELRQLRAAFRARQEELLDLQRRLAQAERVAALGALVARIAHELGTPLHSIAGHLDLLMRDPSLPEGARERLVVVSGEVERLGSLIDAHLRRLRSPQPERAPTDLNRLVQNVARLMDPVCQALGVKLALDLDEAMPAVVHVDAEQVNQVLLNLMQNALDAMPDGGEIVIRTMLTEHGCAISICDTGCGIESGVAERVFEPFFSTKSAGVGTGLGMPLCREIARNHGGDILLDSSVGTGTVVTLLLRGETETP